mmetsp:Transcript_8389/g.20860  ORF Transcript_8389/g.20860 Transcript_8389/m.20860 type:complete len:172 (-) Transcript_8389:465-980(-)
MASGRHTLALLLLVALVASCEAEKGSSPACGRAKKLAEFTVGTLRRVGEFALGYASLTVLLRAVVSIAVWVIQPHRFGVLKPILSIVGMPVRSEQPHTIVDRLAAHYDQIEHHAHHALLPLSRCLRLDLKHLATAYAEASVTGIFLRPVAMPLKAFLVYRYLANRDKEATA